MTFCILLQSTTAINRAKNMFFTYSKCFSLDLKYIKDYTKTTTEKQRKYHFCI